MKAPLGGRVLNAAIWCLVAALVFENVILLRQNHQLKTTPLLPTAYAVRRDHPLKNIGGVGLDGQFHIVSLPASSADHLLLFTFAPTCPECQLQEPLVASVSSEARKLGWRTVWISRGGIEETRTYCEANNIPVQETLVEPPYPTYLRLGMEAVPQLVAVGEKGNVEEVWVGRLTQETAASVSRFMTNHSNRNGSSKAVPSAAPSPIVEAQAFRSVM
jgi:hypothetical protein